MVESAIGQKAVRSLLDAHSASLRAVTKSARVVGDRSVAFRSVLRMATYCTHRVEFDCNPDESRSRSGPAVSHTRTRQCRCRIPEAGKRDVGGEPASHSPSNRAAASRSWGVGKREDARLRGSSSDCIPLSRSRAPSWGGPFECRTETDDPATPTASDHLPKSYGRSESSALVSATISRTARTPTRTEQSFGPG